MKRIASSLMIAPNTSPTKAAMAQATRCFAALLTLAFLFGGLTKHAAAQQSWEYSPYQLKVWVAVEPSPRLTDQFFPRVAETLKRRGKVIGRAAWAIEVDPAPVGAASDMLYYMDQLTDTQLIRADQSDKANTITVADKLYTVAILDQRYRYQVQVRELDMNTRVWGRKHVANVVQEEMLPDVVMNLIAKAFLPVMRIESIDDKDVVARVRSAGLLYKTPVCEIPTGALLQPVVRRNDRLGQPLKGGILVAPWTICQVLGYDGINAKLRMHAGKSNPLGVRKGVRTQRFAIMIRPSDEPTRLLLKSDVIGDPEPLVGYDLYEKDPLDREIPAVHLGKSDWRGAFVVEPTDKPFRLIYVRSGGKLMARMPTVPGHHAELVAFLRDDDRRLEAESYIRSVESEIMDQVVQRKLLERNIQKRLKAGKVDQAEEMVERFQELPKQVDMKDRLDTRQGQIAEGAVDRRTLRLVGQMFDRAEKLISEHISPSTLFTLQRQIQEATGGAPTPPTTVTPPSSGNGGGGNANGGAAPPAGGAAPPAGGGS